jgi:hypothetical protein
MKRAMSQLKNAVWCVVPMVLIMIVGLRVLRILSWQEDYGEAEPLVQTIWPMAQSLKAYEEKFGCGPASLGDLVSFDPELNVSALAAYEVTLSPHGKQRLYVRVNRRFAFEIDDRFEPSWAEPTGVLQPPRHP